MTRYFRVHSLSYLLKEFNSQSKHATNRVKFFTSLRSTGRERAPFFGGEDLNKKAPGCSSEEGDLKYKDFTTLSKKNFTTGVDYRKNVGRRSLERFCGYISKEVNDLSYDKSALAKDRFRARRSQTFNLGRTTDRQKHFFTRVYATKNVDTKSSLQNDLTLPMVFHKGKSRVDRRYKVRPARSFKKTCPRKPMPLPPGAHLSYYDRKDVNRLIAPRRINIRKTIGRKVNPPWVRNEGQFVAADSFEKSEAWPDCLKKVLPKTKTLSTKWGKKPMRETGKVKKTYNTYLDYKNKDPEYLKKKTSTSSWGWVIGGRSGKEDCVEDLVKQVSSLLKNMSKSNRKNSKIIRRNMLKRIIPK